MSRATPVLLAGLALLAGCFRKPSPSAHPPAGPFVEAARQSGLDFRQRTGAGTALDIIQTSAGGCGLLDFDGDGLLDLYFVQGRHIPGPGGGNRLYRNRGNGSFEDVTERAGVRGHGYGMGCAAGDYNGDGRPDLYVCNNGASELYRNRGDGTFEDVSAKVGAAVRGCSVGAVFADLDGDEWPDLFVVRYLKVAAGSKLICSQSGVPTTCDPQDYFPEPGVFLHNVQGRRFEDRTRAAGLVNEGRGMSASVADVDEDGHPDLLVTNDTSANSLFMGDGKGHFRNRASTAGVAYGEMGVAEANMGCDFGDYDGDGRLDLFIGVMQDRSSLLCHNEGRGLFTVATRRAGLAEATAPVVSWGVGFLDADNDGDLDLFQANGHVQNLAEQIDPRLRYAQPRQYFENVAGQFTDRSSASGPALLEPSPGRGAAFGDLDNDGDVDIAVNNLDSAPTLLINQAETLGRHWLRVRLKDKSPNSTPEGAVVELRLGNRTLLRHLHSAYSYASANDSRLHFGLGSATSAGSLVVHWPDGARQELTVPGVDREILVERAGSRGSPPG